MGDLIKKTTVVPFINTGTKSAPVWTQIKKSTSFTISMNPQTKSYDFISSETPQTEIEGYQPSLAQEIVMFKGEKDYEAIFDMLYHRVTGKDAHKDALIVFYKHKGTFSRNSESITVYQAWKIDALVTINQMDTVNENIGFDLALNDIEEGAIEITSQGEPSFIKGSFEGDTFTQAQ
ncbi:hypothetical protein [Treponema pectinovorum]|uniref:hypothetical protein n=1 Tax=Treponema pectinovorum TaxID=164 RepID=UPI0011CA70ED|nr:hypothetical protein [Treponema pectinovorum]